MHSHCHIIKCLDVSSCLTSSSLFNCSFFPDSITVPDSTLPPALQHLLTKSKEVTKKGDRESTDSDCFDAHDELEAALRHPGGPTEDMKKQLRIKQVYPLVWMSGCMMFYWRTGVYVNIMMII